MTYELLSAFVDSVHRTYTVLNVTWRDDVSGLVTIEVRTSANVRVEALKAMLAAVQAMYPGEQKGEIICEDDAWLLRIEDGIT